MRVGEGGREGEVSEGDGREERGIRWKGEEERGGGGGREELHADFLKFTRSHSEPP